MKPPPLTDEQKAEIVRRFRAGDTIIDIYLATGHTIASVEQAIREAVRDDIG